MTCKLLSSTILAAALSFGVAHAQTTTINAGGSSLAFPTYVAEFNMFSNDNPSVAFSYAAVGSGSGQLAFLNNNISLFASPPAGTLTYGTVSGTSVAIGASDAYLLSSQVTGTMGGYPESSVDGPLIQIPTFGTPITMAYNEAGTKVLTLSDSEVCGILSGKITDWNTLVPTIKPGTTINVAYRSDGSGTTFLLTQHLAEVCNSSNSNFPTLPVPVTKTFAALFTNSMPPSNFTGESGSAGVAGYLTGAATGATDTFGYLSPDYTSIAPMSANTTSLKVASLINFVDGKSYSPTVKNTELGLANGGPGSVFQAPPTDATDAANPLNWIPQIPQTNKGYPIVGYTTFELSTCYALTNTGTAMISFLTDQYTNSAYKALITNNGFAALANTAASKYTTAVKNDFLTDKSKYNLNIDNAKVCASYQGR